MTAANTTMIGSMPQKDAGEALAALAQFPLGIPTWPQLPQRSFKESMTLQYGEGFPGIVVDEKEKRVWLERDDKLVDSMTTFYEAVIAEDTAPFAISEPYAAGMHRFIADAQRSGRRFPIAKGQVVGPFTFGFGLSDGDCKAVWFDEQYRDIVVKGLAMKALWQVRALSACADQVIIFLDEPIFSALGTPAYIGVEDDQVISAIDEIAAVIHGAGARMGLHCCGNMEWSLLTKTAIDILAFDAYSFGDKVALYPAEIDAFLKRGGTLAWGIVPTDSSERIAGETGESLCAKVTDLENLFVGKGVSSELLRKQRYFTPSCGIGNCSIGESLKVLEMLQFVGARFGA